MKVFTCSFLLILLLAGPACYGQDGSHASNTLSGQQLKKRADTNVIFLKDVLFEIEKELNVFFNFDDDLLNDKILATKPEIPVLSGELDTFLPNMLKGLDLVHEKLDDHTIIIKRAPKKSGSFFIPLPLRQNRTVTGTVTGTRGETLTGVNIILKGTQIGTTTDITGEYSITFPDSLNILVFSYLGFMQREVVIGDREVIDVVLEEFAYLGEELVVIGYGTQQRRDLTGSIGSVSGAQVSDQPYLGVDQALQGQLAGVQVSPASGKPGDAVSVRIRGTGTVNQSDPLYVIDGFPVSGGISAINMDDIESIDVLKDASATAIYGARGANGVVIITTKRGHHGGIEVDVNMYAGFQELTNPIRMLNASQYAEMNNEARLNAGEAINPAFSDPSALADSANWVNEIFRTALMHNYSVSVRGGSETLRYNLSAGFLRQDGVIISSGFERKSFRLNLDSDISPVVDIGNSFTYSLINFQNEGNGGLVRSAMNSLPTQPVRRNGSFSGPQGIAEYDGDVTNPVGLASINEHSDDKHRLLNNFFLRAQPLGGLTLRSEFGVDFAFERSRNWSPRYQWGIKEVPHSHLFEGSFQRTDWLWDNTVTYEIDFEHQSLTLLGGMSAQKSTNNFTGASGQEFVSEVANQLDNIQSNESVFGSTSEFGLLSYMGRIMYNYQSRYLVTATARYDGSSRFGANHRFGLFPSASVAWRLSSEPFMRRFTFLDDLKIRAGYGYTGNQEAIPAFGYIALLDPTFRYTFGNSTVPAVVPQNFPNDDLRWEKVIQSNVGVDMMLFDGKIDLTVEYYIRDTEDMLLISPIPITSGFFDFERPILNVGSVRNEGFEIALRSANQLGGVQWNSALNVSFNDNVVLRLSGVDGNDPIPGGEITFNKFASRLEVGHPIGAFYGYVTDGIFQNRDEIAAHAIQTAGTNPANSTAPGDIRFKDLNGDGIISDDDRTFLGDPNPDFYFGWTNTFYYKAFDLTIFMQGTYGNSIFNANKVFSEAMATAQNQTINTLNRWNGEGTSNSVPRATTTDPNDNTRVSDRYIEDGSYLRIKNVTLGYDLPVSVLEAIGFRRLRVYASFQNLYTFTRYTGFDPEVGVFGIDNSVYPPGRTIMAGLNIGL
jgi:TonB-linked SusC/RagA family outer membrane protein